MNATRTRVAVDNVSGKTRRVVMLAYAQAQILDVTGPLEVFSRAARWLMDHHKVNFKAYTVEVISDVPGPITTSSTIALVTSGCYEDLQFPVDTLLIAGGIGFEKALENRQMLGWIREAKGKVRRLGSICTGSLILAQAGLLNGKRATTHWAYCDRLKHTGQDIDVEADAIFVSNGSLYTSAGVTTGMDMALAMVEEDWGREVSLAVARELVLYVQRPGEERQFSQHLQAQLAGNRDIASVRLWILDNLAGDLSVSALAQRASMSVRTFSRRFARDLGMTPAKYVDHARVEAAQRLLNLHSRRPLKHIATSCGFKNEETMRRAFRRVTGAPPGQHRLAGNPQGKRASSVRASS